MTFGSKTDPYLAIRSLFSLPDACFGPEKGKFPNDARSKIISNFRAIQYFLKISKLATLPLPNDANLIVKETKFYFSNGENRIQTQRDTSAQKGLFSGTSYFFFIVFTTYLYKAKRL